VLFQVAREGPLARGIGVLPHSYRSRPGLVPLPACQACTGRMRVNVPPTAYGGRSRKCAGTHRRRATGGRICWGSKLGTARRGCARGPLRTRQTYPRATNHSGCDKETRPRHKRVKQGGARW
jgi:hypothetical protein